jgi:hypothetical protein
MHGYLLKVRTGDFEGGRSGHATPKGDALFGVELLQPISGGRMRRSTTITSRSKAASVLATAFLLCSAGTVSHQTAAAQGLSTLALDALRVRLNRDLITAQLEPSYVTAGGAPFNIRRLGNAPNSLFEGMIVPNLSLYWRDSSRFAVFMTPKIIVRQRLLPSLPVRSPSFMPRLTFLFALRDPVNAPKGSARYLSLVLSHHSNGQEDSTYRVDSITRARVLNLKNGEFSTNYIEAGYNIAVLDDSSDRKTTDGVTFVMLGLRVYPKSMTTPDLWDRYGLYRLTFRGTGLYAKRGVGGRPTVRFELALQALMGGKLRASALPFVGSFDMAWRPHFLDDFWLFTGVHRGQDYYNLRGLGPQLSTLRIGVMGTTTTGLTIKYK